MKTTKVLVTRCEKFKPIIGTWIKITEMDWDRDGREIYRTTINMPWINDVGEDSTTPLWLHREDFQYEAEVKAKDYVLNYFEEFKTFPNHVMYKDVKYTLEKGDLFTRQDYTTHITYNSRWGELIFRMNVKLHFDDKLRPVATFSRLSYLGMSSYEIPEPKEYHVE